MRLCALARIASSFGRGRSSRPTGRSAGETLVQPERGAIAGIEAEEALHFRIGSGRSPPEMWALPAQERQCMADLHATLVRLRAGDADDLRIATWLIGGHMDDHRAIFVRRIQRDDAWKRVGVLRIHRPPDMRPSPSIYKLHKIDYGT